MKKLFYTLACTALLFCLFTTQAQAFKRPGTGEVTAPPVAPPASDDVVTGPVEEPTPVYPMYTVYTPKITQLHNANAMVHNEDGVPVYYIPTLESLPVSLKDLVTNITVDDDEHKFALVYEGYFDTEAHTASATNSSAANDDSISVKASQDIYSDIYATPALKAIGYDLLLSSEEYKMSVTGSQVVCDYKVTTVDSSTLTYNTIVMDLYKALGLYKYDIKFAFGIDPEFDPNTSPILQELSVLTSDGGNEGIDDSEANTYVAVTRTNPEQYWKQYLDDGIMLVNEDSTKEACEVYNSGVSKASNANLTYAEFFQVACAMLNLYGESALTSQEVEAYLNVYGAVFPKGMFTEDQSSCVKYLVAKGIVDPDYFTDNDVEYDDYVTYDGIEDILYRIKNPDARLTIKMESLIQPSLQAAGYTSANVTVATGISDYAEYDYDTSQYYDFFIQVKGITKFYAKSTVTSSEVQSSGGVYSSEASETSTTKVSGEKPIKVVASSNLRLTPTQAITEATQPVTQTQDGSANKFTYMYNGVVDIDGSKYYHFKVNPSYFADCNTFYLTYEWKSKTSETDAYVEEPYDNSSVKYVEIAAKPYGGIYSYTKQKDGSYKWKRTTFKKANADYTYKDKTTVKKTIKATASSTRKIVSVGVSADKIDKANISSCDTGTEYNWSVMFNNQGVITGKSIKVSDDHGGVYAMWFESTSGGVDKYRLEILTNDVAGFRDTEFFNYLSTNDVKSQEGYYRAEDGSLLVSFNYLKDKGLATGITKLDNDAGYLLTLGDYGTNVALMTSDSTNYIIVGDTIYGNPNGETLVAVSDNDFYINYRACLGWSGTYTCVSTGDGNIMAMSANEFNQAGGSVTNSVKAIKTFFPDASTNLLFTEIKYTAQGVNKAGFSLAGSYGLSPYTIVMADENGCDYLFVWHLNDVVVKGKDKKRTVPEDEDKAARQKFQSLTGIVLEKQSNYSLKMFTLDRDTKYKGLKFVKVRSLTSNLGSQDITYGWVYTPPTYKSITKALNAYANSALTNVSNKDKVKKALILPIFKYDGKYYDANVNMCTDSSGGELKYVGTMLGSMCTRNESDKVANLNKEGIYEFSTETFTNDWNVITAPVGMFAEYKNMGKKEASSCTSGALYFGTSKCSIRNNTVTIAGKPTAFDSNEVAVCTYKGVGASSIYAVTANSTSLGSDVLEEVDSTIEHFIDDPASMVDWGQYKFDRLTKNLDAWSTVALIFILNILPRVAMLLFFVLMLLSLIRDVKPWKMFCQRVFDVYSFLTMGHMSVDTIDTKKVMIISLVCMSLFIMIMDGQLFNFIIFIAKFLIALYQK